MAYTPSTMLALGTHLPSFKLPDVTGIPFSSDQVRSASAVLVAFICPHCPFVGHVRHAFSKFTRSFSLKDLAVIAICSSDLSVYPEDGPAGMKKEMQEAGYAFPYLRDDTQAVAKLFRAACTPDFFLYDRARKLVYRGQFDDSRPGNGAPLTGDDLRAAVVATIAGDAANPVQKPSVGCGIQWIAGNEPDYVSRTT